MSATFTRMDESTADDWAVIIPAGIWHNVVNTGAASMRTPASPVEALSGGNQQRALLSLLRSPLSGLLRGRLLFRPVPAPS